MRLLSVAILTASTLVAAPQPQDSRTRVDRFVPASDDFAASVREYEHIWAADGARMVAAMGRISGLSFVYAPCTARFRDPPREVVSPVERTPVCS
jgi:hypothetical protein